MGIRTIVLLFLCFISSIAICQGNNDPELTEELRVRGGLPNFFSKLNAGDTVRIAYMGGSITMQEGWRIETFDWLQAQYPATTLIQINAAVSGTGADFAACRARQDLLSHQPDMVFVEYRVNGGGGYEARAIEGLIRQIWQGNPETDICMVYTIGEWMLKDLLNGHQYWFGKVMEIVANEYNIPSIDLGVEVVKQLKLGNLIFKGPGPVEGKLVFSRDGVHPQDAGHILYSAIVARSLLTMNDQVQPQIHTLPTPIEEKHFANASLLPVIKSTMSLGWEQVDNQADTIYTRDPKRSNSMLKGAVKCHSEGETISIEWEGVLIGFTTIPQGRGMEAEVSVDGEAPKRFTFKQSSDKNLFAQFFYAPEQKAGLHKATLRVTKLPEGTSFYCGQFLIIDEPSQ